MKYFKLVLLLCALIPLQLSAQAPGDILVSDFAPASFGGGGVVLVSPVGGAQTDLTAVPLRLLGIAFGENQEIYVSEFGTGEILELDPVLGTTASVASGLGEPWDMVLDGNGDLLVVDRTLDKVWKVDPSTGIKTTVSPIAACGPNLINGPHSIALEADGSILVGNQFIVGSNTGPGSLLRINPATGCQTAFPLGDFDGPTGVVVDIDGAIGAVGDIYVANNNAFGGSVIKVDPVTGAQTVISTDAISSGAGGGAFFADPQELVIDGNADLLVLDSSADAVIKVAPSSGAQTLVSSAGLIDQPVDIVLVPSTGDDEGPITSDVISNPNPGSVNESIALSANIDDSTTGGATIASAHFEISDDTGVVLSGTGDDSVCADSQLPCPDDAAFDDIDEDVVVTIDPGDLDSGVYDACVRGTDAEGNVGEFTCSFLVVYNPDGGFVTGGGWIQSDAGFCTLNALCEAAEGKANFGFVSKYKKGASVPTGNTNFQFKAGDLHFKSTEYEWLVIAGPQAMYKGSGTINGSGDYGFLLTAKDSAVNGGPASDTFRIKIWDKTGGNVVYDNGADQAIGGGSIVIHQ